jgi:hypothetical protein
MIPEWKSLKNYVIEVHGFRHFFRNKKSLTGASVLKKKIVEGENFKYFYISLDEWLIAGDQKNFLINLIEHLNSIE